MNNKSRMKTALKNISYSVFIYFFMILFQFINRTVFIELLSAEYLGINGLFTNILSFLALAELGVGSAISYALYEPLSKKDNEKVKSLMLLYKKIYTFVGFFVLIVGSCLTPFLPYLIKNMPKDIEHIYLYYLLYVVNSGISYFFTYKRTILISDQKQYISAVTTNGSKILLSILQIVILVVTHNYTLYLCMVIIVTVGENLFVSHIANRQYPYLKEKQVEPVGEEAGKEIKKNISAMLFHKVGAIIVYSTDNIIISKFVGLVAVGLYSNYTLIIHTLNNLLNQVFVALTATIGNMAVEESTEHSEKAFYKIMYANYVMYAAVAVCILCLTNQFILLWVGEKYVLSFSTLVVIVINFYISGMRKAIGMFKDASGIFWQDRYKPLIESVINIVASIPLARLYGVQGVLMGTILSTILVPVWFEGYVTYKYAFKKSMFPYVFLQIKYFVFFIINSVLTYLIVSKIPCNSFWSWIVSAIASITLSIAIIIVLSYKNDNLIYYINCLKRIIKKKRKEV